MQYWFKHIHLMFYTQYILTPKLVSV
uniref:Uncharacterized protein n=1 Tax=Anguilla anguilla TaxID=7936 RepID=A0A0E9UQE6_ANGAN